MEIIPITTPLFETKQALIPFLVKHLPKLKSGDIIVVTSKIVALSQNRVAKTSEYDASIKRESSRMIKTPWGFLTETEYGWCINAGIDESNANHGLILLPTKASTVAADIRLALLNRYRTRELGVIIADTKSLPLRQGTVGRTLGYAGFEPLKSYIGKRDLFGRKSRVTQSNLADALAASAVLVMGEGDEQTPLALIRKAPVRFTKKAATNTLNLPVEADIYKKLFATSARSSRTSAKKRHQ